MPKSPKHLKPILKDSSMGGEPPINRNLDVKPLAPSVAIAGPMSIKKTVKPPGGGEPSMSIKKTVKPPGGGEPSLSIKKTVNPPGGGEPSLSIKKTVNPPGGEPKKKEDDQVHDDDEYYINIFEDIVEKELPKVDSENPIVHFRYPIDHFQDDLVCIIAEIYENSGYLVIPDQELMMKIAKSKIDDKKKQTEFVYGEDSSNSDVESFYVTLQRYTQTVRKSMWDNIAKKYDDSSPPGGNKA